MIITTTTTTMITITTMMIAMISMERPPSVLFSEIERLKGGEVWPFLKDQNR